MHLKTDTSSNSHFSAVPSIKRPRNAFGVAEKHVTTIQFDKLFPIYHKFIYPGDTLSVTQRVLARLQTQIGVLYDDLYLDLHAWFVPLRLIQTDWARFQFNAQPLGPSQDNSSLTTPKVSTSLWQHVNPGGGTNFYSAKSIYDYFGYPAQTLVLVDIYGEHMNNYLPRAYNLIWNENYRDENLQSPRKVDLGQGPDDPRDYGTPASRGKRHDRFTSALPFQQKGPAAVIPFGAQYAPVERTPLASSWLAYNNGTNTLASVNPIQITAGPVVSNTSSGISFDPQNGLRANLSSLLGASVNELRNTIAIQHLLEADARGGTRDVESILHRWGVTVPDFRLQRPEYLGGTTFSFDGHVVPQTSETATTPQGNLAQFSQTMTSFNVNHSFVEHGVFMILISARSNITYQEGLPKELSYRTRFDFYQPEFANLGEVSVKNKEIYMQDSSSPTINNGIFGYQEYGYELRYGLNRVSSEMRSNYPQSLDSRHMADDYASLPTLGPAWIQSNTPISRNIAVAASVSDPIELNSLVSGKIARTLPMYSVPGLTRL